MLFKHNTKKHIICNWYITLQKTDITWWIIILFYTYRTILNNKQYIRHLMLACIFYYSDIWDVRGWLVQRDTERWYGQKDNHYRGAGFPLTVSTICWCKVSTWPDWRYCILCNMYCVVSAGNCIPDTYWGLVGIISGVCCYLSLTQSGRRHVTVAYSVCIE